MTAPAIAANSRSILLLNSTFEELGMLSFPKAARLLALGKAVVHEADDSRERLREWAYPKVIRLCYYVKINYKRLYATPSWSKHGVRVRDKFKCAYCSGFADTIDHVMPRSRGGKNTWSNTVASCFGCNNRKDNRTPKEANMALLWQPFAPTKAQLLGR